MPAQAETPQLYAEVPHERGFGMRRVPGDDTKATVEVGLDRNRPQPSFGEPYIAKVTVPLLDAEGNKTGTERTLIVTDNSPRRVLHQANRRLVEMGSPYLVGSIPRPDSTGYPILQRRSQAQ